MFERFTDRARRVIVLAQEEAQQMQHSYIGTEHILLGLAHEGQGVAAKTLESVGISRDTVRSQIEATIGLGQAAPPGHIPFTPRCKRALEYSLREALGLGHNYIGTEHILLGLLHDENNVAVRILTELGAEIELIRKGALAQIVGATSEGDGIPTVAYLSKRDMVGAPMHLDGTIGQATQRLEGNPGTRCWKVHITIECEMEHIPAVAPQLKEPHA